MTIDRRGFIKLGLGGFLLPVVGCGRPAPVIEERAFVFGTLVDVSLATEDQNRAASAIRSVMEGFQWMNRDWHAWKPGALTELNRAIARGEAMETLPSIVALIQSSSELWRTSQGLFNPAIGKLVTLWGFHDDEMPSGALPDPSLVQALVAQAPVISDLVVDGRRVSSRNRALELDFGGHAKGVALDWALDSLATSGCTDAIVNLGGNLAAIGSRGGRAWRIGVKHPQGEGVIAAVEAQGREAVVTSGSYERYREYEGVRYPHIIDPRSGRPTQHVASATIIHPKASVADGAATALVVAGTKHWPEVANSMGLREVMVIDDDGDVQLSKAMVQRVRFMGSAPRSVQVVDSV